jgi:glycine hydroxymethyltransferase
MREPEMEEIAGCIDTVVRGIGTGGEAEAIAAARARVQALVALFPLPYRA